MSNPFSNLFGSAAPAEDSSKKFHDEISKIFRITLNVEDPNESIILPGMIEEEFFNSSNLLDAITERMSLETPLDYLLNADKYVPKSGLLYLMESLENLVKTPVSRQVQALSEKSLGTVFGEFFYSNKVMSKLFYAILIEKNGDVFSGGSSQFNSDSVKLAIKLTCLYGRPGSLRWIFSSFSIDLKMSNLQETSLLLFKAQNFLGNVQALRRFCKFASADSQLCPFRFIFSKSSFPSKFSPNPADYPFFKDFDKSFKSRNGLDEELNIVKNSLNLFNSNLFRIIKPVMRDDEARSVFLKILFKILTENKAEGSLASTVRDPMQPVTVGFTQSLNITSLLLQLTKPFCNKEISDLNIQEKWCFMDKQRFDNFAEQTTLQPLENRTLEENGSKNSIFEEKQEVYSTLFWLTHWAMRQGLHPITKQMNYQMRGMLNQLYGELKKAEESGDEMKRKRTEIIIHYLLIKMHTLEAILTEQAFKFNAIQFFHLSMKVLINVVTKDDLSYKTLCCIPEFVIENINDVIGQLDRYSKDFLEATVNIDFMLTSYKFVTLFMESPKYAFNPHLRKDLGPLLQICCPFSNRRSGKLGSVLNMAGQLRHQAIHQFEDKLGLAKAIIGIFCDCELITDDEGFDSKLNFRLPFYTLLEGLWEIQEYQDAIIELANESLKNMTNQPLFLRFISLLIDDSNNMMGHGLDTLKEIRTLEIKRNETEEGLNEEDEKSLSQKYKAARSYIALSEETLNLFGYISFGCDKLLVHTSLVHRIAEMSNYFLNMLVGKTRKSLIVKDMRQINFMPANMVHSLAKLYVNLSVHEDWNRAICQDERSFSMAMISETAKILSNSKITGHQIIGAKFREATLDLEDYVEEECDFEEEPPDEYCDPIMGVLMEDPVRLPTSGQIVCRNTIARQLLSSPIDPFNREPLTLDKVEEQPALKAEILKWKVEQREKQKAEKEIRLSKEKIEVERMEEDIEEEILD